MRGRVALAILLLIALATAGRIAAQDKTGTAPVDVTGNWGGEILTPVS